MKFKKKDLELKQENHTQVVIVNDDGQVCLVSRKDDHNDFGLPGGKLEGDETYEEAAIRETKEETGLDISELELIFAMHRKGNMGQTFLVHDYEGELKTDEPHKIKWGKMSEAMQGSFKYWNTLVDEALESRGIEIQ